LKLCPLFLNNILEIDLQVPLFVGFYTLKVLFPSFCQRTNNERIEVQLSILQDNIFKGSFSVFSIKVIFFVIVVGEWLRSTLVIVLLKRIDILAGFDIPNIDPFIKG